MKFPCGCEGEKGKLTITCSAHSEEQEDEIEAMFELDDEDWEDEN